MHDMARTVDRSDLMTIAEAVAEYNITRTRVRGWLQWGHITHYKRGDGRVLVSRKEIEQMVAREQRIVVILPVKTPKVERGVNGEEVVSDGRVASEDA